MPSEATNLKRGRKAGSKEEKLKLIPLTRRLFAEVSDHRYEHLIQWNWYAYWNEKSCTFYAGRNQNMAKPGEKWVNSKVSMHRYILGLEKDEVGADGKPLHGLHRDGDGLNNQDENIHIGNNSQNAMERKPMMANNTSGYKGVYFRKDKKARPWGAFIKVDGKMYHLGFFATREAAYAARIEAEKKRFGEFRRVA